MKSFKKMMALVIAAVMIFSTMSISVYASEAGAAKSDASISVTKLSAGDVVTYYQVIEWQDSVGWVFKAPFTSLSADDLKEILGDAKANPPVAGKITQAMANKIAAAATSGGTTEAALTGTGDLTWTKSNPAPGLYMVVVAAGTPGVIYNPAFVGADFDEDNTTNTIAITDTYSDTAVAKKTDDKVKKTTKDSNSAIAQAIDSYVGQDVDFFVETTVPVFLASYTNPKFDIVDEIQTTGIDFKSGTIKITLTPDGTTYAVPATGLDNDIFTAAENGKKGYSVSFKKDFLSKNTAPVEVKIEYQGTITNTAEFNVNEDNNEVTVTYSNGPGNENGAMKDRTNHYTFSIGAKAFGDEYEEGKTYEFVKVGVDESGNPVVSKSEVSSWIAKTERHPLAGATFGLYTDASCAESSRYKYGEYADATTYPDGAEFTTGADGIITFKGLAAGTYYIKELDAPSGYIKDDRVSEVIIEAFYKKQAIDATVENGINVAGYEVEVLDHYTVTVNNVSVYDSNTNTYGQSSTAVVNTFNFDNNDGPCISSIEVSHFKDSEMVNTKGVELPSTGGMGTTLFYLIGAILVLGAGILLVTRRRMSAN